MAQYNITITEELLHGLFLSNGRDEAFSKLLEEILLSCRLVCAIV
jgi:putative transposase